MWKESIAFLMLIHHAFIGSRVIESRNASIQFRYLSDVEFSLYCTDIC